MNGNNINPSTFLNRERERERIKNRMLIYETKFTCERMWGENNRIKSKQNKKQHIVCGIWHGFGKDMVMDMV